MPIWPHGIWATLDAGEILVYLLHGGEASPGFLIYPAISARSVQPIIEEPSLFLLGLFELLTNMIHWHSTSLILLPCEYAMQVVIKYLRARLTPFVRLTILEVPVSLPTGLYTSWFPKSGGFLLHTR